MPANSHARALAAACLSALMFGLEISSVPAILPTLEAVLRADFQQLQWTMNAYTMAVATVLVMAGTLADRFGRKRIFVTSIMAFGISSLLCGVAPSMTVLIAARTLQGASGGAMLTCQFAILSDAFREPKARAKAFGWWGIVTGVGLGFGPLVGGGIAATLGWAWVFLIHVFIAIVTLGLAVRGVQESRDPDAQALDIAGIATISIAVFCLVFYITQGAELGFTSRPAIAVVALAAASLTAFVAIERSVRQPMIDFSVFRIRRFTGALYGSMGMNFSFWPFMIYLPIWFQAGLGLEGLSASAALLAYTLPTLVVPPVAERLALRYGAGLVIPGGMFTIGLGFLIMAAAAHTGQPAWLATLVGAVIAGIGLGAINTPVTNTTTGSVPSARSGMASGIDMSARMISLALNIALMGFVLVGGVSASLRDGLGGAVDAQTLAALAQRIAAGNLVLKEGSMSAGAADAVAHAALTRGYVWVMLYATLFIWGLATLSAFTFGKGRKTAVVSCEG
ncbi:drug resistance transporter, EmrB/QacA subfamily [Enhydrobacter aerosaccus]|uniref:Drug resistance transporter, EmrB/QacA subfamily n=1 Tax=Enhydrobacter aerosaccus TaxID=225324 RepID=A0A1T4LUH0_9HYPH|nr:MFS transporter [Enhydrobacter aerosaccus]SJZ58342.1 drug resistance transporter, EmrB/QacA subfamily [Enhydrobacter aerosaccus]